jgi:hypothetical protein
VPPPIFKPGATTALRVGLAAALLAPIAAVVFLWALARSPLAETQMTPVQQPIDFDHRHHAGDDGIDCRHCHCAVETSSTAGFPETAVCMSCHAQVWNRSPITDPIRAHYFTGRPIAWKRVYRLLDFVFFNHAIHVNKGVGCVACHGRVDEMPLIEKAVPMTMSWCLDCHRSPLPNLRPLDRITDMAWKAPEGEARARMKERLARELDVHPPTDCIACHR